MWWLQLVFDLNSPAYKLCKVIWFYFVNCDNAFCWYRRVLIFPNGNNVDCLSMYLDVADALSLPYGWNTRAQFSMSVINHIDPKYSVRKGTCYI